MALSTSEQAELNRLEYEKLSAEKQAAMAPSSKSEIPKPDNPDLQEQLYQRYAELKANGFAEPQIQQFIHRAVNNPNFLAESNARRAQYNANPNDRAAMLAKNFLPTNEQIGGITPNQIANTVIRGGGSAVGQTIGAMTGPVAPVAVPVLGGIGAMVGEYAAQAREGGPKRWGAIFSSFLPGAIPGGPLASAGTKELAKEGVKYGAANLAAKTVETGVDEGRLPTAKEALLSTGAGMISPIAGKALDKGVRAAGIAGKELANTSADATRKATLEAGFVVPPGALENEVTMLGSAANYGAHSTSIFKEASKRNQPVVNKWAREYAELPANTPLGKKEGAIDAAIERAGKPYEAVAQMSPQAELNLKAMKDAQAESRKWWKSYENDLHPDKLDQAKTYDALADSYHDDLVQEAKAAGKTYLVDRMDAARIRLAKLHFLEWATNPATGNVSAKTFGLAKKAGVPLTDAGETIADAWLAYKPAFQEVANLGNVDSGKTSILENIAKKFQLSPLRQRPTAAYAPQQPDFLAQFAKQGTAALGRNTFLTPLPQATQQPNPFLKPSQ